MWRKRATLAFVALLTACAGQQTSSPPDFSSKLIALSSGRLAGVPGGKPMLLLTLQNKSEQALWVKVRIVAPSPNSGCAVTKEIASGAKEGFQCAQVKVVADTDYPVFVTVYLDEGLNKQVETPHTKMRFPKSDVAAFERFMAPPKLPATYKSIRFVEDPGVGTGLFGSLASSLAGGNSVVVVKRDSLDYSDGDKTLSIPVRDIRSVEIENGGSDANSWVKLEYAGPEGRKIVGFQGNPFSTTAETLEDLAKAIRYAVSVNAK